MKYINVIIDHNSRHTDNFFTYRTDLPVKRGDVVQVPFKYYKELDDIGIVPVSMEVLTITNQADGANLTVISYMCLDEKVLQEVLKQQSK